MVKEKTQEEWDKQLKEEFAINELKWKLRFPKWIRWMYNLEYNSWLSGYSAGVKMIKEVVIDGARR